MSRIDEYELLKTLTWNEQSCSLAEIVDKHSLPQVIQVYRGYDGGEDGPSLGHGEALTLHALRKTKKLTADDSNGNKISIAFDCPYKCYVLPTLKDCNLNKCTVEQLPLVYPKVKYLVVLRGHYGTENNKDSINAGEFLEILSVEKRKKETKVRNVETGQTIKLTSLCSGEFKPVLQTSSLSVNEVKTQFGFPTRIHFIVPEDGAGEDVPEELLKLVSESPDVTLMKEILEELVITTTVANDAELKVCYEIPKDLDVKVLVSVEYIIGDIQYKKVATSLDMGFDVTEMLNKQQSGFFYRAATIKEHKYESIKDLFLNMLRGSNVAEEEPPPLQPRKPKPSKSATLESSKPPVCPRLPPRPHSVAVFPSEVLLPKEHIEKPPPKVRPKPPPRQRSADSCDYENIPYNLQPGQSQASTHPPKLQTLNESEGNKPNNLADPTAPLVDPKTANSPKISPRPQNIPVDAWRLPLAPPPTGPTSPPMNPSVFLLSDAPKTPPPLPPPKPPPSPRNRTGQTPPTVLPKHPSSSPSIPTIPAGPSAGEEKQSGTIVATDITRTSPPTTLHELNGNTSSTGDEKPPEDDTPCEPVYSTVPELEDPYGVVARIPKDLSGLSVTEVCQVLKTLHMERYIETFRNEDIDGRLMKGLGNEELESLNVIPFHRKKIISFINGWRPKH